MKSVILRNVPGNLHRLMKATAAMRGQTLNAFLITCAEKELAKVEDDSDVKEAKAALRRAERSKEKPISLSRFLKQIK